MMRILLFTFLILSVSGLFSGNAAEPDSDYRENPTRYIEVADWNFYVAARVAILYNVTLENKSPLEYNRLKIRVNYYSRNGATAGKKISQQTAVLNITLPPHSKKTYLKSGYPIGAGSPSFMVKNLEILSAEVAGN